MIKATSALVALAATALLAGCQTAPAEPTPEPEARCAVSASRDWSAWINRMPGPGATPTLHVTGQIDLPTPGYTATLTAGAADRSATPVQQLILNITPPSGMVAQVITTETVNYQGPTIAQSYRGVTIRCAGQTLAEITEVPDVH
jgi:hypothetical protein